MALVFNLRFDLRRLSDAALAERFDQAAGEREAIDLPPPPLAYNLVYGGCIRHPLAYGAEFLGRRLPMGIDVESIGAALVEKAIRGRALDRLEERAYLLNCDLQDLMYEMQRRVAARRRVNE